MIETSAGNGHGIGSTQNQSEFNLAGTIQVRDNAGSDAKRLAAECGKENSPSGDIWDLGSSTDIVSSISDT